jgi:hypothetical protein
VSPAPSPAVRRFAALWGASLAVKLAAVVVFVLLAAKLLSGGGP